MTTPNTNLNTARDAGHTPGPWESSTGDFGKGQVNRWIIRKHEFPKEPFEGDLENEWGIYPPIGESGPVALVAGEENARLIAAAPELLAASKELLRLYESKWSDEPPQMVQIRAAIAKTTGGTAE